MQKIISLFQRNYDGDQLVRDEIVPGAEWVVRGEGQATRKFDGTCCLVKDGKLFKRYDAKNGKKPPDGFVPAQEPDPNTGHWPGWIECQRANPANRWHWQAWDNQPGLRDGTYELCGPKVQSDAERAFRMHEQPDPDMHILIQHGCYVYCTGEEFIDACPRSFDGLRRWFRGRDIEGIVWHHPDGRMAKIKKHDFGMKRND